MLKSDLKILIIEDSKTYAEYVSSILITENYHATLANTGKSGLQYLNNSYFNLVLLDMELPDFTGLDIVRIIRKKFNQNRLPVVFISATTDEQKIIQALESGANDFIQKPFTEITLKLKIKNLLELQQASEQLIEVNTNLKESEAKYRLIFENSPIGILSFDENGVIRACNENFAQIIGTSKERLIGLKMLTLPDKQIVSAIQNSINGIGTVYEGNYHSATTGKITPVKAIFKPLLTDNGLMKGGVGIVEDITEQIKANEALENRRLLLRTLIDNIPDSIYSKDLACRKTLANFSEIQTMGAQSESEVLGKDDFEIYPNEIAEKFFADDQLVMQSGKPVINREEFIFDKNGIKRWLLTSKLPLHNQNGQIIGLVGIGRNITEYKQAQEALKKSESTKSKMVANIGDVIVIIDKDRINRYKSSNLEKLFGWKPEDLIGYSAWEIVHPDDRQITQQFLNTLADVPNATGTIECRYQCKDGNYKWIEITVVNLLNDPDIQGFLGNYHDITERKHSEAEIKSKNAMLTELNADKDRFMSILAHDLKSPFVTILGFLELLNQNVRSYDIDKIEYQLGIVSDSAQNLFNLLEELLTWVQSQTGKIPFNPIQFNFTTICNEVVEQLKHNASVKNISIKQLAAESTMVLADIDMFKTILRNLLSNAIKFSNLGGLITINAVQNPSNITISVSDNGVGMTPKEASKLFDVSQKHSTIGTQNEIGTGLGLLLCKEFVEKHGGKIWVESKVNKGSKFSFTLPWC